MKIQQKDNYTLASVDTSFDEFSASLASLKSNHLVLEVSENLNIDDAIISLFLKLATSFQQNGMSLLLLNQELILMIFPKI